MGKADDYDLKARQRIARHIKAHFDRLDRAHRVETGRKLTHREFADEWGVERVTVTNILNQKAKGLGLDMFLKAVNNLDLDPLVMIKREPRDTEKPQNPSVAPRTPQSERASSTAARR